MCTRAFHATVALYIFCSSQLLAGLFPFPDTYLSVETNDWLNRPDRKNALHVDVCLSTHGEPDHPQTRVSVDCFAFDAGCRGFDERDQELFLEATKAAKERRDYVADVVSPAINPRQIPTHFESKQFGGNYFATVKRGQDTAKFEAEEGERLLTALRDAKAGAAWYEALLNDETLLEPSSEKHPPHAKGYHFSSRIGEVDMHGFIYEVALDCSSFRGAIEYNIGHTIAFGKNGRKTGTIGGNWGNLLQHVSEALHALNQRTDYDFVPDDRKYRILANRQTDQVDVTIALDDFFSDRTPVVGHVSADQLEAVNNLIAEVPAREKWFREHESWFFTAPN